MDRGIHDMKVFPISQSQRNIWELEQIYPATPMNNICTAIHIKGSVDLGVIQDCLNHILREDLALRTRVTSVGGTPCQYHVPFEREEFPFYDFSKAGPSGVERWKKAVAHAPIPLCDQPLYRFLVYKTDEENGGILLKIHHMICDGWSLVELANRISSTYLALLAGKEPEPFEMPDYEGHVRRENEYLASPSFERDRAYWEEQLAQAGGERAGLRKSGGTGLSPVGERASFHLPQTLNYAVGKFCAANRVAPFSVYCIALSVYLQRMSGSGEICVGVPILNRPEYEDKRTGGMFVSTLPFFFNVDLSLSMEELNFEITDRWYDLLRHQRCPFSEISALARKTRGADPRLFDVVLSYQDGNIFRGREATMCFSGEWLYSGYQTEQLVIHLSSLEGNGQYAVDYDYLSQLFSREDIIELHEHVIGIMGELLEHSAVPVKELRLLSGKEREKVLYTFNKTGECFTENNLRDQLEAAVGARASAVALIFGDRRMTYGELYDRVCAMAGGILERCGSEEKVIALCLPRGLDLIAAMLAAVVSGNAWAVIPPELPAARAAHIVRDSGAALIVTAGEPAARFADCGVPAVTPETLSQAVPPGTLPESEPERLAYVVYTSGSTGAPKGVLIEHGSLLNFAAAMDAYYGSGGVLSLCNSGFDVFVLETVCALLCGRTVILASDAQMNDAGELAALIRGYGAGFMAITPSRLGAYLGDQAFARAIGRVESIVCGGEPVTAELMRRLERLTSARVYNQYGPSETTIGVSCKLLNGSPSLSAGRPMNRCRLYVLDENRKPLPAEAAGELYIGGACVGRGYLNNDEATQKAFLTDPFELEGRMYRSGDLAKWDKNGEIHILGRRDGQIKLHGHRIETGEIAAVLCGYPGITGAAVCVVDREHGGSLAAYYTADRALTEEAVYEYCAGLLPAYMIPQYAVRVEEIPLTANGKTDYARLPQAKTADRAAVRAETGTEKLVLDVFCKVLERRDLDAASPYFQSGGDSLNAMAVISELLRLTGVRITMSDLRGLGTPARIAVKLDRQRGTAPAERAQIVAVERESYPLTSIQKSVLFNTYSDPTGIAYNMPGGFVLPQAPDEKRLEEAIGSLIASEDILRTAFLFEGAGAAAKVQPEVTFALEHVEAADYETACAKFVRPFDLSAPPLLRAAVWHAPDGACVLLLDVHHIVNDGEGTPLLFEKLDRLYRGERLPKSEVAYQDYACFAEERAGEPDAYWTQQLTGLGDPLQLPTDHPRPKSFDYRGAELSFPLEPAVCAALEAFCGQHAVTPYVVFAAAYGLLLSSVSGERDVVVGSPVAGRVLPQTRKMLGAFINTLPLRLRPEPTATVGDYLTAVSESVSGMLDHADADYERDILAAAGCRAKGHTGLYSVMFSMRPVDEKCFTLGGQTLRYLPVKTAAAKMDLVLEAAKKNDGYEFFFQYASALFDRETIALYGRSFAAAVRLLIGEQSCLLGALSPLSKTDRYRLVELPAHRVMPYTDLPIDAMADAFAEMFPEAPAVVFGDRIMTYEQFRVRSDSIAAQLAQTGVRRGDVVGVFCERTPDLLCGLFAVLKCGAAYLPLTAQLPSERIEAMLDVAGANTVLCDKTREEIPNKYTECIINDNIYEFTSDLERKTSDRAQVLFTSGSTGQPKGVMLSHRSLCNLSAKLKGIYAGGGVDGGVLCSSSVLFDSFTMEVIIPLATGLSVVLADGAQVMNPRLLADCMRKGGVQALFSTPSRMRVFLGDEAFAAALGTTKVLLSGGEAMSAALAQRLLGVCGGQIWNLYGPAEATVFVTAWQVSADREPTIGYPIENTRVYVLDEQLRPAMPTAAGELYIGGDCLSSGYIGREDLTEKAFVPDPFTPGQKLYRTGDLARLLCDGRIDYLGRRDSQVKLNGQRIETDEIAGCMMNTGLVADAAVVAVKNGENGSLLRAFVVAGADGFDEKALRTAMAEKLPKYMMPAEFAVLEHLPMTATGKTDLRALAAMSAPEKGSAAEDSQPAQNVPEASVQTAQPVPADRESVRKALIALWKEVLAASEVDENRSFFEQGGTSLAAMNLLIRYFKLGWEVTLELFYDHPTLAEQTDIVCSLIGVKDDAPSPAPAEKPQKNVVLVTGATGFLGAHLVNELLRDGETEICCLVRGDASRLAQTLDYYFGAGYSAAATGVRAITGDVSEPLLGLSQTQYEQLTSCVKTVYHAAADVRHYMSEADGMRANVTGTENVIAFARAANARLGCFSTLSVGGSRLTDGAKDAIPAVFDENCIDIGQNWRENIYVKTKFLAEEKVRQAAAEGLDAVILRVGRLVGRQSDGKFQKNTDSNYFYNLIGGLAALNAYPAEMADTPIELTAVDACARAAVLTMKSELRTAHLANPHTVTLAQLMAALTRDCRALPREEFVERMLDGHGKIPMQSLATLTDVLSGASAAGTPVIPDCQKTVDALAEQGFLWEPPEAGLLLSEFVRRPAEAKA